MPMNPIQVQQYLKGIQYPADKGHLIKHAEANKAPGEVMETIKNLPERDYISPAHVTKAVAETNR
jgi:hypothetical protein